MRKSTYQTASKALRDARRAVAYLLATERGQSLKANDRRLQLQETLESIRTAQDFLRPMTHRQRREAEGVYIHALTPYDT